MADLEDLYRETILDHNKRPRNHRKLEGAHRSAKGFNPLCGDRVTVSLKLDGDVVQEVVFEGSGCAISTASASLMTVALKGKTLTEARALFEKFHGMVTGDPTDTESEVDQSLGKLRVFSGVCEFPARIKCATLAWHTVQAALNSADHENETVSTE